MPLREQIPLAPVGRLPTISGAAVRRNEACRSRAVPAHGLVIPRAGDQARRT